MFWCLLVWSLLGWPQLGWSDEAEAGILPQSLIVSLQIEEVFEYECPQSHQCQLRCASGVGDNLIYQNVKRAELAKGKTYWVFAVQHVDSLGKGHRASGFLPEPASCVMDNLEFINRIPVVDGVYKRKSEEVIFDMSPTS